MKAKIDPRVVELFDFKSRKGSQQIVRILEVAIRQMASLGILETNFGTISKELKTNRAHIVYYFKDLETLILESSKFVLSTVQSMTVKNLASVASPKEQLESIVRSMFAWIRQNPDHLSCFILLNYFSLTKREFYRVNKDSRELGRQRMVSIFKTTKYGKTKSDSELSHVAGQIQQTVLGRIILSRSIGQSKDLKEVEDHCLKFTFELTKEYFG